MEDINLKSSSRREYFLIHGYTGSPDDFNGLPEYLHKKYNVNVKVILLKGHGTTVKDLDNLQFQDFLRQTEVELKKDLNEGKEIILGGTSFGGQLSLILASRYPVKGVFVVGTPYKLKFPFNLPHLELLSFGKKYWKKIILRKEKISRKNAFYYKRIHVNALEITRIANTFLEKSLAKISCPLLIIHSKNDFIASFKSAKLIGQQASSQHKKIMLFSNRRHSLFFTNERLSLYRAIEEFFETNTQ